MMVDARRRQQARDRRAIAIGAAVRQDQNRIARSDRAAGDLLEVLHRPIEAGTILAGVEQHRQRDGSEARLVHVPQLCQLVVVDHRILDPDLTARLRPRIEQVALGPNRRPHRGHQFLADGVERRVRDLREQLREIVVQQPRTIGQDRQRRVGAHRADRLFAARRHRGQKNPQVFMRVAEGLLAPPHGLVAGQRQIGRRRKIFDVDQVAGEPLAVRPGEREIALDLVVGHDSSLDGVDEEDPARMQPLLDQDVLGRNVEHADLGRHDHEVVLRHVIARRTQTVSVEHRADERSVGERDRRRTVPWLHQGRVVLVKGLELGAHALVAGPRLRNHHQDRVRERPPRHHEELEDVVERRRVAAPFADDREDLLQIVAEQLRSRADPRERASS